MSSPPGGILQLVPDSGEMNEANGDDFAEIALDHTDGDAPRGTRLCGNVPRTDADDTSAPRPLETAAESTSPRKKGRGQAGRSGPPGNKNARTHGMYSLQRAIRERGLDAIDGRSALGRALREYRADLVRDLGSEANLSTAELHLVDLAVRDKLFLDSLDAALAERPLLNRKRGSVAPALEARFRMADSATRRLVALGLKRVKRRKSVQEIMAEIATETATMQTNVDDYERDSGTDESMLSK